jgi:hypothetical protein
MHDPQELRDLARKCRSTTNILLKPSVNKQLWLWAAELADYADEIERCHEGAPSDAGSETGELT